MRYKTALSGLEFFAYHGLYPEERLLGAKFLVDVIVEYDIQKPITAIGDATNYEIIFGVVKAEMAIPADLIESVADRILHSLKQSFPQAQGLSITIHKPNPAGLFKSGIASVTLSR